MSDSIQNLVKRIRNYNAKKVDELLPASAIQFDGETFTLNNEPIKVTDTARRQLLWYAKIPAEFFLNKLDTGEQASVFNRLFSSMNDTQVMFRLSSNYLYGIVSPQYRPLDNILIVDLIREVISSGEKLVAVSSVIDPDFTIIRVIKEDVEVGGLTPMLQFTNSENGLSSLRVWAGVFRMSCSNGLLVGINDVRCRWMHFGAKAVKLPDVAGLVNTSINYTRLLDASRTIYLTASRKAVLLESISKSLTSAVAETVVETINKSGVGGRTLFDVVCGVTQAAQSYPPQQMTEIEKFAATLLH